MDNHTIGAMGIAAVVALVTFAMGHKHGVRSTLMILRGHESDGKTLKESLDYEIAVMNGEKPWKESE